MNEDSLFESIKVRDAWAEYVEVNQDVIDRLIELAGSEQRAVLFLLLRVTGQLFNLEVIDEDEE